MLNLEQGIMNAEQNRDKRIFDLEDRFIDFAVRIGE